MVITIVIIIPGLGPALYQQCVSQPAQQNTESAAAMATDSVTNSAVLQG